MSASGLLPGTCRIPLVRGFWVLGFVGMGPASVAANSKQLVNLISNFIVAALVRLMHTPFWRSWHILYTGTVGLDIW